MYKHYICTKTKERNRIPLCIKRYIWSGKQENPRVKTGLVDQVKFLVELSYHSNQHAKLREINSTMKNLDQYLDHLVTV